MAVASVFTTSETPGDTQGYVELKDRTYILGWFTRV